MTLQISITIPSDEAHPTSYLEHQLAAIGFIRRAPVSADTILDKLQGAVSKAAADNVWQPVGDASEAEETAQTIAAPTSAKRERGKPSPGRQRRTRQEVEEDEAAEQAAAGQPAQEDGPALYAAPEPVQQISTGEERVDPAAETEQPAADIFEQAAAPKTLEDVKKALGAYVKAFGMAPAQADGQLIFREVLGEPPTGEQAWRMTLIPDDGSKYGNVVAAIEGAIKLNPYKRERVA